MKFTEYAPDGVELNFIKKISKDWLLITAKKPDGSVNTMTASWGGIGELWGKPVCVCVIRPQRYTYEFAEEADRLTLSFLDEDKHDIHKICGFKSGRDCDKLALAGLDRIDEEDITYFEQSSIVYVGKKLYKGRIDENGFIDRTIIDQCYPKRDYHYVYICEIERILVKE